MNSQASIREDYVTSEQFALALGISRRTLHRWRRLKKGPPGIKVGRAVFYRRAAVEKWLLSLEAQDDTCATVARYRK